jgi:DNA-binding CsgD family transcriptional regulator
MVASTLKKDEYRQREAGRSARQDRPRVEKRLLTDRLSAREIEIARLVSEGLSNKEIALALDISPHTVSTHMRRIYDKLGCNRRARLAGYVFADGVDPFG